MPILFVRLFDRHKQVDTNDAGIVTDAIKCRVFSSDMQPVDRNVHNSETFYVSPDLGVGFKSLQVLLNDAFVFVREDLVKLYRLS